MKTAVSIPDDVFELAERVAERLDKSRSELYADALREYLARRSPDVVTAEINEAVAEIGQDPGHRFVKRAAQKVLERSEW